MHDFIVLGISVAVIVSILVCGQYVLTGLTGQLSIVVVPYSIIGMIFFAYFISEDTSLVHGKNLSFLVAFPLSILCTVVIALLYSLCTYKFRSTRELLASFLASSMLLGVVFEYGSLFKLSFGVDPDQDLRFGGFNFVDLKVGSYSFSRDESLMIFALLLFMFVLVYTINLSRSSLARKMRAVASNEDAAVTNGTSALTTIIQAHIFTSATSAMAGVVVAYMSQDLPWQVTDLWVNLGFVSMIQIIVLCSVTLMKKLSLTLVVAAVFVFGTVFVASYLVDHYEMNIIESRSRYLSSIPMIVLALVTLVSLRLYARSRRKAL